jgi:hypothetical protein
LKHKKLSHLIGYLNIITILSQVKCFLHWRDDTMLLTYISSTGESVTLRPSAPFFLGKADGLSTIRQSVNTVGAPEQDGAFYIFSTLDMRNITLEGNRRECVGRVDGTGNG